MSEISDAIQAKCLAFSDRIIKLNDYLLAQAVAAHENYKKSKISQKGKQTSSFLHQTSDISVAAVPVPLSYLVEEKRLRTIKYNNMCTVNIKVDDALVRRINPGLSSRESINKWLQGQVNAMIEEMAAEDTVDLETAREMLHQTIREVYAEP